MSVSTRQFRLLRNEQGGGNYLIVDLEGTSSNRDGIGAELSLVVDNVHVRRPSGKTQSVGPLKANQTLELVEP